jgi:ATP-dependent Clp protease ATP-binding subunit ClpC
MLERFTDRARKVMALANQEAQHLNHEYLGTEHILLGLIKEASGVGASVLKSLDVDLVKLRDEAGKLIKSGSAAASIGKLPHTPGTKKVIEHAIQEARGLNHNYVGTEHLLLGLLHEQDEVAAQVLANLGLKLEDVRKEISTLLGEFSSTTAATDEIEEFIHKAIRQLALAWDRASSQRNSDLATKLREGIDHLHAILAKRQDPPGKA